MSMKRAAVLLLFGCVLVTVYGESPLWGQGSRPCSGYMQDPEQHEFKKQEEDHCEAEALSDAWEDEIGRSSCKVRTVLVKINADAEHTYHPTLVEAQRCVGHCNKGSSCQPTGTGHRMVQVTRTNTLGVTKCGQVRVADHHSCECQQT